MTKHSVTLHRTAAAKVILLMSIACLPTLVFGQSSATATAGISAGQVVDGRSSAVQPKVNDAHPTNFLGLTIGMPAKQALNLMAKPANSLEPLRWIADRRILDDTIPFADCALPMRRSVGFDSSNSIQVIGLTYKTTPKRIAAARACADKWISAVYGPPTTSDTTGGTLVNSWSVGNARLTLEAKGYTEQDYFVLIYFYPVRS